MISGERSRDKSGVVIWDIPFKVIATLTHPNDCLTVIVCCIVLPEPGRKNFSSSLVTDLLESVLRRYINILKILGNLGIALEDDLCF
jgi:hypothetical protein